MRHGLVSWAFNLAYRAVNRVATLMILKVEVVTMDTVNKDLLNEHNDGWRFLSPTEVRQFSEADTSLGLNEKFLSEACDRGSRCYALVKANRVVSYGWYSRVPTRISHRATAHFDQNYRYFFKAFTSPEFRGLRLHGTGLARALKIFTEEEGIKGIIYYVEAHNQSPLKARKRIGSRAAGTAIVVGIGDACTSYASPGCRTLQFRVQIGNSPIKPPERTQEIRN